MNSARVKALLIIFGFEMSNQNIVLLFNDYVEDLPDFAQNLYIKSGQVLALYNDLASENHDYYYILVSDFQLGDVMTKLTGLINKPDEKDKFIELNIPTNSIKSIIEQV